MIGNAIGKKGVNLNNLASEEKILPNTYTKKKKKKKKAVLLILKRQNLQY